jgi:hypothetical protein
MKKKRPTLLPVDLNRCQAEERPGGQYSFMTLGPIPPLERCKKKPVCVATELKVGADGMRGAMSLCAYHFVALIATNGPHYSVKEIK